MRLILFINICLFSEAFAQTITFTLKYPREPQEKELTCLDQNTEEDKKKESIGGYWDGYNKGYDKNNKDNGTPIDPKKLIKMNNLDATKFKLDGACKCLMGHHNAVEDKLRPHEFSLWENNLAYKDKQAKEVDAVGILFGNAFPYDGTLELLFKISCFLPQM